MKKLVLLFALTCIHALLFGFHSDLLEENRPRQDVIPEDSKRDAIAIQLGDNPTRRGYIGLAIGPAFAIGDFAAADMGRAKTGLHINLVNFGYLFSKHVGIAASLSGGANRYDSFDGINYDPWAYASLHVGPLFSFPLSASFQWDLKPAIGYSSVDYPSIGSGRITEGALSFNAGTAVRYHIGRFMSASLNVDFFTTNPSFSLVDMNNNFYTITQRVNTLSISAGLAYRLR